MAAIPAFPNLDRSSDSEDEIILVPYNDHDHIYDDTTPHAPVRIESIQIHDFIPTPEELGYEDVYDNTPHHAPPVRIESIHSHDLILPTPEELGYEDAAPSQVWNTNTSEEKEENKADLGYGSGSPTTSKTNKTTHEYDGTKVPRRSSLKFNGSSVSSNMPAMISSRRASMGCASTTVVEVRVRGERFPVQRRRSIDFESAVEVKEIVPVTDHTDGAELWLQPEDFANMKAARRAVVLKHKEGTAEGPDEDIRGLEKYLDRSGRVLKNRAWDTVLLEQDEQELNGEFNDQRIADLYRSTTFTSPDKAAAKGKEDQKAVEDYLMTPRTTKLMMRRLSC
jgi:hypothetical protein